VLLSWTDEEVEVEKVTFEHPSAVLAGAMTADEAEPDQARGDEPCVEASMEVGPIDDFGCGGALSAGEAKEAGVTPSLADTVFIETVAGDDHQLILDCLAEVGVLRPLAVVGGYEYLHVLAPISLLMLQ